MNPLRALLKSEYLYRPQQLLTRLRAPARGDRTLRRAAVPGGCEIEVSAADDIGLAVLHLGVYDLVVTELLWRLADAGEVAADVGANIGYMTAVLAARVAPGGAVWSFEPHPAIYPELRRNVDSYNRRLPGVRFETRQSAVSSSAGTVGFASFADEATNRGTSAVTTDAAAGMSVPAIALDQIWDDSVRIGVMKIDIEGHELDAFRGARRCLAGGQIRDIVFEEHRPYPSDVTTLLESHGYTLFRPHRQLCRTELLPADSSIGRSKWEATNFLATRDPQRAQARLMPAGWQCLRHL